QLTLFFALRSRPPRSPLFPYTTLFRSGLARLALDQVLRVPVSRHEGLFSDLAVKAHLFDLASMRPNEEVLLEQAEDQPVEAATRSEEHTSELQSRENLVCRLLLEKKK